jgi:hypothetical protein
MVGSAFCCHVFDILILLYSLIFYGFSDPLASVIFSAWLLMNITGLTLTVANGIFVSHAVSFTLLELLLSECLNRLRSFYISVATCCNTTLIVVIMVNNRSII